MVMFCTPLQLPNSDFYIQQLKHRNKRARASMFQGWYHQTVCCLQGSQGKLGEIYLAITTYSTEN